MKSFHEYWTFSAIRGALTMLACIAILALPQATSSMLSLPVLITLLILCLATYSVFDAGLMILLVKLLPARAKHARAFYGQAVVATVVGILLYLVAYEELSLRWLMLLASSQAAFAAIAEFIVAQDTHRQYRCLSCYATGIVLVAAAVGLPFAAGMDANVMSLALAGYVGLYGMSQFLLGARMLFVEYRKEHPAAIASTAWQAAMVQPAAVPCLIPHTAGTACALCPADALCHDDSLRGQLTRILRDRQPAVVRSIRVADLLAANPVALHKQASLIAR